jgi:hypothetical protein
MNRGQALCSGHAPSIKDAALATRWLSFEYWDERREKEEMARWLRVGRLRQLSAPMVVIEISGQRFQQCLCFLKIKRIKAFVKLAVDGR